MITNAEAIKLLQLLPPDEIFCVDIWHHDGYHTHIVHPPTDAATRKPYVHEGRTYCPAFYAYDCITHRLDLQDGRRKPMRF